MVVITIVDRVSSKPQLRILEKIKNDKYERNV